MEAYFRLGLHHQKVVQEPQKALEFYELAVQQGDNKAKFHLNCIHELSQQDVVTWDEIKLTEHEINEIEEYYITYRHDSDILNNLGFLYEIYKHDNDGANQYYMTAAELGCHSAQYKMAHFYARNRDFVPAYKWSVSAAEQGHIKAQALLASLYVVGKGIEKNYEEALKWATLAAEKGNVIGQYYLGYIYMEKKDNQSALKWLLLAATKGHTTAQCEVGFIFLQEGPEQDFKEAHKWLSLSADSGYWFAQYQLGYIYFKGLGVVKDLDMSHRWFSLAAEANKPQAQYFLGRIYLDTSYSNHNNETARKWFELAALQGDRHSYHELGVMYEYGLINEAPNYEKAAKHYRTAADAGFAPSQSALALLYSRGKLSQDMAFNYQEALKWWNIASTSGYPSIHYNIANFYQDKMSLYRNYALALHHATLSADLGHEHARHMVVFYQSLPQKIAIALQLYLGFERNEGPSYLFFCNFLAWLYNTVADINYQDDLIRPWVIDLLSRYFKSVDLAFNCNVFDTWYSELYG